MKIQNLDYATLVADRDENGILALINELTELRADSSLEGFLSTDTEGSLYSIQGSLKPYGNTCGESCADLSETACEA